MVTVNKFGYIQETSSVPKYWSNRSENDSALSTNTLNTYMNNEAYDSCFGCYITSSYSGGWWLYWQNYKQLNTLIEIKIRIWGTGTIMGSQLSSLQISAKSNSYGSYYYAKSDTLVLSGTTLTFKHRISYRNNTTDYSGTDINVTFPSSFIGEWVKITMGYEYLEVENINTGVKYSSGSKQTSTSSLTTSTFGIGYYYFVRCINNYLFNTAVADTVVKHDIEYIECYTWDGSAKTVKNHYTIDPTTGLFKDSITGDSTDTSGITGDTPLTLNEAETVNKYVSSVYYNNNQIYKAYMGSNLIFDKINYNTEYLTFESLEDQTFAFTKNDLSYSLDGGSTWTTLTAGESTPTISSGKKILWKGSGLTNNNGVGQFSSTGAYNACGNIMSLLYGDNFENLYELTEDRIFLDLFKASGLIDASNLILPATTLTPLCYAGLFAQCLYMTGVPEFPAMILQEKCYQYMFENCYALTTVPELPATTLALGCYSHMFISCTGLTTVPSDLLPETTLATWCYEYMFQYCSALKNSPALPATTAPDGCYYRMFDGCSALTTAPALPATTLSSSCYRYMFYNCSSLTTAPELPATTLAETCYSCMFQGCSNLQTAPSILPATTLGPWCYEYMFYGCTSLTTAPALPATTVVDGCYQYMFRYCTSLTTAPVLPATTLIRYCYRQMFYGCRNLNYIKMMATDISASNCLNNWVSAVSSSGTFVKNSSATWNVTGTSGIPSGWTVQTVSS